MVAAFYIGAQIYGSVEARRKQRAAQAAARSAYNAGLTDRNVTALQSEPQWRVVYGRALTAGDIVAIFTSDKTGTRADGSTYTKSDAYKHLVIHIASHECEAINEIYLDGVAAGTLDANGWVTAGELYQTVTVYREIDLGIGASTTQPAAVTVQASIDTGASSSTSDGLVLVPASYSLSVGNTVITNTSGNPSRVSFTMAVANPSVRIQKHLGSATQTVDAMLNALVPAEWTATDRLQGLAYCVVTVDLENQRFQGGPPNATFDISGRKVLDVRTGLTAWSANAALCIRDWLTNEWGFNCLSTDVDNTYAIASANACDVVIPLNVGGVITSGPTYTCNGVFSTGQAKEAVLQDLAESMGGWVTYGAQWLIQAGAWTVPVSLPGGGGLTDDDLHGQIELVQGGAGMDETFNTARGSYIPAGSAVVADFDVYSNPAFVAADGRNLYTDVALPFTNDKARGRNLARIQVERNRDSMLIRYPAKLRAWPLQVGDRIAVTSAEYGFVGKTFRVTDWQFSLTSAVVLLLQEETADTYDLADAATADPARNTLLPNPWVVTTPSNVVVASGTGITRLPDGTIDTRARVTWDPITDPYLTDGSGQVLVRWRRVYRDTDNVWTALGPLPASEIHAFIGGLRLNDMITVEVSFRNGLGALSSPVYVNHTVTDNMRPADTNQIAPSAATAIFTDIAATPITRSTALGGLTPISRVMPAAGTYEITVTAHIACTAFASPDVALIWFSGSGAGSFIGSGFPQYSITANGQQDNISQSLTLTLTGGGPWQLDVSTQLLNGTCTLVITDLVMRTTQIKR